MSLDDRWARDRGITTCNGAVLAGYTEEAEVHVAGLVIDMLVIPGTNYLDHFIAFDTELMEMVRVNHG